MDTHTPVRSREGLREAAKDIRPESAPEEGEDGGEEEAEQDRRQEGEVEREVPLPDDDVAGQAAEARNPGPEGQEEADDEQHRAHDQERASQVPHEPMLTLGIDAGGSAAETVDEGELVREGDLGDGDAAAPGQARGR